MSVLLPYVVTPVAVALIFSQHLQRATYGLANNLLNVFGIPDRSCGSTTRSPATSRSRRWSTSAGPGYNALILLAAMQAVPRDHYESAAIDGAGAAPPLLLDHGAEHPPDPHLRGHHRDDRRPADLRRAAAVRPVRPPAAPTASSRPRCYHLGLGCSSSRELRPSRRGRVAPVPAHRRRRPRQLPRLAAHRHEETPGCRRRTRDAPLARGARDEHRRHRRPSPTDRVDSARGAP